MNIDFKQALLDELGLSDIVDGNRIQVVQYDPITGQPIGPGDWAFGLDGNDRAFRWYDDDIPAVYPEVEGYLSDTPDGTLTPTPRANWGNFSDSEGSWESGRLAWSHIQSGNQKSHYAIYFDVLPSGGNPYQSTPRGFLGDGGMRTLKQGTTTTGVIEQRIDVHDWDGDGLVDLVSGNLRGGMVYYKNIGTAANPDFGASKIIKTTDGQPIDIGWNSAPKVIDFDGDGVEDLLTGGQLNRLAWYKNVGANSDRQLVYQGLVKDSSGQVLTLPTTPNPEIPSITQDYHPVIDAVDLDMDNRIDLVAGGYITGRLYYYRNIGSNPDGTPLLELQGPLEANGSPIDTEWGAAPTFADFNSDGLVDLVTGTFAISSGVTSSKFLQYYENVGAPTSPAFESRSVPHFGNFPAAALGTPRAVDYNGDGLIDLAVSTDANMYLYRNVGTPMAPKWLAGGRLSGDWVSSPMFAGQFVDWNNDGELDIVSDLRVSLNQGQGSPGLYASSFSVLPAGQTIPPKPGGGDGWQFLRLFDLDWNGVTDIIDADHDGKIWLHRNVGTVANPSFDTTGVVFMQLDGNPIDVGPGPGDPPFDQLQGSRATYSIADVNGNVRPDIVIVNFDGTIRYYENEMASPTDNPLFTLPTIVGQLPTRGVPFISDWDGDSDLDILASSEPGEMLVIENLGNDVGGRALFAPGFWVDLIDAPYGSINFNIVDFNQDGDADILVDTSHRYTVFTDGSFLQHGYADGSLIDVQSLAELTAVASGDYNMDGVVDGADFVVWQRSLGQQITDGTGADGDGDGIVGPGDLQVWQSRYGETTGALVGGQSSGQPVPEPSAAMLLASLCGAVLGIRKAIRR
ncbi:VCBS repeat-containing protein [Pirellulales bacterium]|nr:VCBS repeat-containing protein [Pirellulales bacterium]